MSMIDTILHSTTINWLHNFIRLLRLDNYVHDSDKSDIDLSGSASNDLLNQYISASLWSQGESIDLINDILEWVNTNLEELLADNTIEVTAIQGNALNEFIKEKQLKDVYLDISPSTLDALNKSVILVAFDSNGDITADQMIRSKEGLSSESLAKFSGNPILKINIPT